MKRPRKTIHTDEVSPEDSWPAPDQRGYIVDDDFDYLDQPPVPLTQDHEPPRLRRMMSRRSLVAIGVASIAGAAAVAVPILTEGSFYPGTAVGGVDISQMTYDDALALMHEHFAPFENTAVDFEFEEQTWNASLAQLGFEIDYAATLDAAFQHGRSDDVFGRYAGVLISPNERTFPVIFRHDEAVLRGFLEQIGTEILGAARDARLYLSGTNVEILPNRDGRQLNIEQAIADTRNIIESARRGTVTLRDQAVVSQVTTADLEPHRVAAQTMISGPILIQDGSSTWTVGTDMLVDALVLPAEGELTEPYLDPTVLSAGVQVIADEVYQAPKNAVLTWNGGVDVLEPEVTGYQVNVEQLTSDIIAEAMVDGHRAVRLPFNELLADVRSDNLDELGIVEFIGEGTSSFAGSSFERAENVRVSCQHLTHTLIPPGGTFSFNDEMGRISIENGFVEGKIIQGNWVVSDIGGGACQASTTVFRAALNAGFAFEEWNYHNFRLAFYEQDGSPPGLDAAIYQPNDEWEWELDLKFTNPTDHWVLLEMGSENDVAYTRLYGTPPGWNVQVSVPFISPPKEPEGPLEKEDDKLKKDERVKTQSAAPGFDVQAIREVSENGEVIDRWEFWSYYQPQRETWLIGPGTPRKYDENGEEIKPTQTPPSG
jgi:vancomycin resistance protein YoaR